MNHTTQNHWPGENVQTRARDKSPKTYCGCDQIWVRIPHVHTHSIVLLPHTPFPPYLSSSMYSSGDKSVIHTTPWHLEPTTAVDMN